MSVKGVLILSETMHLAPGRKNSIVPVNFAIGERLFLQGLIFHFQEGICNCSSSNTRNNNIPTKGGKRRLRIHVLCSGEARYTHIWDHGFSCLSTVRNVMKTNFHPGIPAYPIFLTWKKFYELREVFLTEVCLPSNWKNKEHPSILSILVLWEQSKLHKTEDEFGMLLTGRDVAFSCKSISTEGWTLHECRC